MMETCRRGHPFTEENTYRFPSGKRTCRICRTASGRAARERAKANPAELPTTAACASCAEVKPIDDFYRKPDFPTGHHPWCKVCVVDYGRLAQFGMTVADYEEMAEAQGGVCAVCGQAGEKRLCIDHDHETGEVRGLLCHLCNLAIGNFKDDPVRCLAAADYLLAHAGERIDS